MLAHTPAHFARSVLEGLNLRMGATVRELGIDPSRIPVLVAADPLLGAARMACDSLGD